MKYLCHESVRCRSGCWSYMRRYYFSGFPKPSRPRLLHCTPEAPSSYISAQRLLLGMYNPVYLSLFSLPRLTQQMPLYLPGRITRAAENNQPATDGCKSISQFYTREMCELVHFIRTLTITRYEGPLSSSPLPAGSIEPDIIITITSPAKMNEHAIRIRNHPVSMLSLCH